MAVATLALGLAVFDGVTDGRRLLDHAGPGRSGVAESLPWTGALLSRRGRRRTAASGRPGSAGGRAGRRLAGPRKALHTGPPGTPAARRGAGRDRRDPQRT